jgi:hypothetical protein
MKKLNLLTIAGLVLLFTCGAALAYSPGPANGGGTQPFQAEEVDPAPVPEPATILLLGSGLVALGIGVRKMKK